MSAPFARRSRMAATMTTLLGALLSKLFAPPGLFKQFRHCFHTGLHHLMAHHHVIALHSVSHLHTLAHHVWLFAVGGFATHRRAVHFFHRALLRLQRCKLLPHCCKVFIEQPLALRRSFRVLRSLDQLASRD